MFRLFSPAVATVSLLAVAACVHPTGRLDANRFQHRDYPYALFYAERGRPDAPLGPDWKVENFRAPDGHHLYPKAGVGYTALRGYDTNRDGKLDLSREELFYDLLLAHAKPSGAMWIRTVPLLHRDAALPLATLAAQYLTAATAQKRVAAAFGTELDTTLEASALPQNAVACEVSKHEAYRIDFTIEGTPPRPGRPAPVRDGSVVLVRTPYRAAHDHPVLLLIGRAFAPGDHEALDHDFDRLLERVVLGELHGGLAMKGGHTCKPANALPAQGPNDPGTERATPRPEDGLAPAPGSDDAEPDAFELAPTESEAATLLPTSAGGAPSRDAVPSESTALPSPVAPTATPAAP